MNSPEGLPQEVHDCLAKDGRGPLLGTDGKPLGETLAHEKNALTAEECAQMILKAAAKRQREMIPLHGRFGLWMKLLNPAAIDREATRILE